MTHHQNLAGASSAGFIPALSHIRLDADSRYRLYGMRCGACGCVVEGERLACPACGNREDMEILPLSCVGRVHVHTVVHRSYPGIPTPFVAVIVDLDHGGTVRGTLADVDPQSVIPKDFRVRMVFRDSGQRDLQGRPLLCYCFVPEEARAA
jgi:uncharacterized OB-fold protein